MSRTLKYFFRLVKISYQVRKRYFFGALFASVLASITPILSAFIFSKILDAVVNGEISSDISYFISLLVIYCFVALLELIGNELFQAIVWSLYRLDFAAYFVNLVVKKISELDVESWEDSKLADMRQRVFDSYDWNPSACMSKVFELLKSFLTMLFAGGALVLTFPSQALIIILAIIPSIIVDFKFKSGVGNIWELETTTRRKYGAYRYIPENKFKELKLLNLGDYFRNKLMELYTSVQEKERKIQVQRSFWFILSGIPAIIIVGYFIYNLAIQVPLGVIGIGVLSFFVVSLYRFKDEFGKTLYTLVEIISQLRYISSTFEFLDLPIKIRSETGAIEVIDSPPVIEFQNVDFIYPGTDRYIFKNLNLIIKKSEKVAFVGENGAGKSTLIKLLLRFYDVSAGAILINGINIKDISLESWRNSTAVLLQDFENFFLPSVEENIGFGNLNKYLQNKSSISDDETPAGIKIAAQQAKAEPFILANTKGYKEILGRNFDGVDFSGGEHQRIALARTFYRDAGLVILDEPTSAVDAKAEAEIFESIKEHLIDKTVIFVSHRFSTVRIADRIVVIENGEITEDGSHEELLKNNKTYKKMFNLQAKGYK